ncbi:MAG: ClpXP protease specificity-enhancing factor [Gammaproteobacteria bacterium]|nr:MAG: ClpXP protease specificity-enhancing factor [Gammaproteobacteria bacterium]PIE35484.1 MAG: ClpXP protease specificity-enhancing factor [Gammaproteobacteria bacterium]
MNSSRPYLIRALYEWIVDNGFTPYMLVDTSQDSVEVPSAFVEDGRIILNVSPEATHSLVLGNDEVSFNARFSGTAMDVRVPVGAVLAIYARENGQGMMFGDHDDPTPPSDPPPGEKQPGDKKSGNSDSAPTDGPSKPKRPHLKIVK